MSRVGIIAEFNPFHNGHETLLRKAKETGDAVCVMSGNFVQRGDFAIADKRLRAKAALLSGADLVLELPVVYAMSTAQNFALGGVAALAAAGCDTLLFGSECADPERLAAAVERLESREYKEKLAELLSSGMGFAAARDAAAGLGDLLKGANDNLAVEYMSAAKRIGVTFTYLPFKRAGVGHDGTVPCGRFASASYLREKLLAGDRAFCENYMPEYSLRLINEEEIADITRSERAILAVLRQKTIEEIASLPDISEGIENRIFSAVRVATSTEELYHTVKTKRYSFSRVKRLILSAFLGLDDRFFLKIPPYIRVLGMNKTGEAILRDRAKNSLVPLVSRTGEAESLSPDAKQLLLWEAAASDLFSLGLKTPKPCGEEYRAKIIKTE